MGGKKKTVRVFFSGDYEFLCENYGHRGPNSELFCLWCKIRIDQKREKICQLKENWGGEQTGHNLQSLKLLTGKDPVFPFELDRVVVLPLHILLGLTSSYLEMFRKQVSAFF